MKYVVCFECREYSLFSDSNFITCRALGHNHKTYYYDFESEIPDKVGRRVPE